MSKDYARESVPLSERKKWYSITFIWIAVGIDLSAMLLGAELGSGMNFKDAVSSVFIGSILIALLAAFCAYIGASTGLSTSMIAKFVFGNNGAKLVSLILSISLLGWFGVQTGFFAENAFAAIKGTISIEMPIPVLAGIGGILMMSTAVIGYRAIEKLSIWSVPLLLILVVTAVVLALKQEGSAALFTNMESTFSFGMAISLVMSVFVVGAVISPDISRWARSKKDAILASFFGFFFGNSIMLIIAIVLSRLLNESDLTVIMLTVGIGIPGILVLILAQWTTNTSNAYSSGLGMSVLFSKLPQWLLTLIAGTIGTLLAVLGIYENFIDFLTILTMFIAPIGGVYTATYYIGGMRVFQNNRSSLFYTLSFSSWGIGTIVSWLTGEKPIGLELFTFTSIASLDSFIIAFMSQTLFLFILKKVKGESK